MITKNNKTKLKNLCNEIGFSTTERVLVGWTFEIEGYEAALRLLGSIKRNKYEA